MGRKRNNPASGAAHKDLGAPLVVDVAPEVDAPPPVASECLVVFCQAHTHKGKQYATGDSLMVTALERDRLRAFEAIH